MAKFLLVDDDITLAETIAEVLEGEEHSVELVHTGAEGWEQAKSNQYDVLILDWDLPDLNGINILNRFRKAGFKAPVIMLTGHASVSDKELGLDSGADDYLTKPFSFTELLARIRAVLRRAESQAPVYKALGKEDVLKRANLAGTLLASRYEFLEVLGEGGSGIVFKARQALLEKLVAIKMLQVDQSNNDESVARFTREAKAISRLDHPNVIGILDFGITENKQAYMVMDFILGWNLLDLVRKEGALPIDFALNVAEQICDGMAHAHKNGILHRDLKPANVLLKHYDDREPQVKIVDFGLAKMKERNANASPELTRDGQVFGSPMYMSPEQVKGKALDERSDIYSLGCIIYEMLTGCPPHFAETSMDMMVKQLTEEPQSLSQLRPDLSYPDSCQPMLTKVLSKDPAVRQQSMRELKDEIVRIRIDAKSIAAAQSRQ